MVRLVAIDMNVRYRNQLKSHWWNNMLMKKIVCLNEMAWMGKSFGGKKGSSIGVCLRLESQTSRMYGLSAVCDTTIPFHFVKCETFYKQSQDSSDYQLKFSLQMNLQNKRILHNAQLYTSWLFSRNMLFYWCWPHLLLYPLSIIFRFCIYIANKTKQMPKK